MPSHKYINHNSKGELLPPLGKINELVADGATIISESEAAASAPVPLQHLVAVVDNGPFEAALHCNDKELLKMVFKCRQEGDRRPLTWLSYPHAGEVAGRPYIEEFVQKYGI